MPILKKSLADGHYYVLTKLINGPVATYQISIEGVKWLARYSIGIEKPFKQKILNELIALRLVFTGHSGVILSNEYNDYPFKGGLEHPDFLSLSIPERIRRIEAAILKENPQPNPRFFYALARIYFVEENPKNYTKGLMNLQKALKYNIWDNGQLLAATGWLLYLPLNSAKLDLSILILAKLKLSLSKISGLKDQEKELLVHLVQVVTKGGLSWFSDSKKAEAKNNLINIATWEDVLTEVDNWGNRNQSIDFEKLHSPILPQTVKAHLSKYKSSQLNKIKNQHHIVSIKRTLIIDEGFGGPAQMGKLAEKPISTNNKKKSPATRKGKSQIFRNVDTKKKS